MAAAFTANSLRCFHGLYIGLRSLAFFGDREFGGLTKAGTWDPLIKSHQIAHIYQAHLDISSDRSGIEPEGKLENVETKIEWCDTVWF
jgi:hypothetical protein